MQRTNTLRRNGICDGGNCATPGTRNLHATIPKGAFRPGNLLPRDRLGRYYDLFTSEYYGRTNVSISQKPGPDP
jgi:hypothetical protein